MGTSDTTYSLVIIRGKDPRIIRPHEADDAGAEAGAEQGVEDIVLPPRQLQRGRHPDGEDNDRKVGQDVGDPGHEQVRGLVDALLRPDRQRPVVRDGAIVLL